MYWSAPNKRAPCIKLTHGTFISFGEVHRALIREGRLNTGQK